MRAALVSITVLLGACGYEGVFVCDSDAQCRHGDVVGTCEATGAAGSTAKYCLFPDPDCGMAKRWDQHAGDGYHNLCYGETPTQPDAGVDARTDAPVVDATMGGAGG